MALRDISYRHWQGRHEGIWHRRRVIVEAGLQACLQNRWMRYLVSFCWLTTLVQVSVLFAVGQFLVADSIIVQWAAHLNPQLQTFVRGFTAWLDQHPEISVGTVQNLLFYRYATLLMPTALLTVALAIPHLVSRDLSSNAIVIYASKAVTRLDYAIGKAGVALGLLSLTWLGPVATAWFVGNLLAPDWSFFWHSRHALGHSLALGIVLMLFLTVLGLGVSAVSPREKATVGLFVALWLVGNAFVPLGALSQPWLKHLSFQYNLSQAALAIFQPDRDLATARDQVPVLGDMLRRSRRRPDSPWLERSPQKPWPALIAFAAVATTIFQRRTRPE
ncbi:MAG TPA: hypothetical protein PKM73_16540 [Verrucomicrobiota bacterium]|nr:hypothetical protein [Verrucomicrobiota bacterium]HNU51580.1 hypothetical protein [Verrucomicrobiota bacterium]